MEEYNPVPNRNDDGITPVTNEMAADTGEKKESPKKKRGISPFVLIPVAVGTAFISAVLTLFGIALYLDENDILSLAELSALIESQYFYYDERVGENDTLTTAALRGMVSALQDPYATYYTEEEYAKQEQSDSGEYKGLGIVITQSDETGTPIITVYEGSTAAAAGILPGDIITNINGNETANLTANEVTALLDLTGGENDVALLRGEEPYSVKVSAGDVIVPATVNKMLTENVGYIRITGFHGHAVDETKQAIASLQEQGMEKLVLDLRDNPGGLLSTVLDIADLFLEKGATLTTVRSRDGAETKYTCKKDAIYTGEMCVLVNGNSASASELLTGALKDYGRAYIIGTQTYGKGIVQTTFSLPGTDGHVKFTTDAYYTPNGVCIQGEGITPDLTVELSEEYARWGIGYIPEGEDSQLNAALQHLG